MGGWDAGDPRLVPDRNTESLWGVAVAILYLLLRDGIGGQSLGKLLVGVVVVNIQTGRPCSDGLAAARPSAPVDPAR